MATNDEFRLKLTESKMKIHRSTKLETIAAQSIVRNLDSYLDSKYSETRHVRLLPIALRNIVLQLWLMRQFAELQKPQKRSVSNDDCVEILEKRMNVFHSLVSCHTLEVDLTPFIFDESTEHLLKYLDLIGVKATNLKALIIIERVQNLRELNITMCNAIGKLSNLRSLNIKNIHANYTNLKAMCKNLKNLKQLTTRIHFNPNFDESNEREIVDLQIFSNLIFFETSGEDEKFTLNCIQHLPKLQLIDYCTTSIIEELLDRCPNQKFALTSMELTAQSNKEIHLNFPYVTNLWVRCCDSDNFIFPNSLPKFTNIKSLIMSDFPSVDTMIRFLDAYGHGLYALNIINISGQFKLSSILDRCPKLRSLFLRSISILPECSRPDTHSFSTGLIELDLQTRFTNDGHAPLLLDILSVPTLERVTLRMSCERFHLEDIEKLTAMIASRQILGNLKRLWILVFNMERDHNHRVFRVLSNFIKSASAFLPHLTDLKTNILFKVQVRMNSEASLEVAALKEFIDVYQN